MLADEDGDHDHNEDREHDDAAEGGGVLLVLLCLLQLLKTLLGVVDDLLHVEVDAIQDRALIYHQYRELFENLCQLLN